MKRLVALQTLPKDSNKEDFVLALIDYFAHEFRTNKLKCHKNNGYVKVCLSHVYQDKYDCVVVDCCNGKMYLRGKNCNDKYFGRLSKFVKGRASDAYHCCNYNAKRIINRINNIEASFQTKKTVANVKRSRVLDLRTKKPVVLDLRTKKVADLRQPQVLDLRSKTILDLRTCKTANTDCKTLIERIKDGANAIATKFTAFANKLKSLYTG